MPGELLETNPVPCVSREASSQKKGLAGKIQSAKLSQKRSKVSTGAQDRGLRGPNVCTYHRHPLLLGLHGHRF